MDISTEILILGSGAAGMMAGLTAVHAGKKCIILEKGGNIAASNAARAGGPALANTKLQRQENAVVTEEQLFHHMYQFSRGTVNAGLLRNAVSKGAEVEQLFTESGIGMKLLPDTYDVGFRARQFFDCVGLKRWKRLADTFQKLGGKIYFSQEGIHLIKENGRVVGVEAVNPECTEKTYTYHSDAVILATGGYLGNEEMIHKHFGNINLIPLGNKLSNGAGIRMAEEAGGVEERSWGICANEFGGANKKLTGIKKRLSLNLRWAVCGGLLVNRQGQRFMNEQLLSDSPLSLGGEITLREGKFYAVLDEKMYQITAQKSVFEYFNSPEEWHVGKMVQTRVPKRREEELQEDIACGWAFKGTLGEISRKTGLAELSETVKAYNAICSYGRDERFGKSSYLLKAIDKEPYYIFEYEPSAWCTFGGVKTDEYCRLLDADQNVIKGVYVAGVDNGSCYAVPYYDNEGAALGLALSTGIVAAEAAMRL
ncbi:FAD-dependent oxidoreductase [Mediterraneibacter massiliensis]|uniref:FAD-dependent oxidoreductase n=1 Tax=Mediterraneibacter massiliensis TaxID=1720300 RepID=UPI0024AE5DFE|nr:FAD-dependent oxidoreductase [Mediterraneibacter massiliensis]